MASREDGADNDHDLGICSYSKCKKCGMILPLDTDAIEKHLDSECEGFVSDLEKKDKWYPGKNAKKIGVAVGQRMRTSSSADDPNRSKRYSFSAAPEDDDDYKDGAKAGESHAAEDAAYVFDEDGDDDDENGSSGKFFTPGSIVIDCLWENECKLKTSMWGAASKKIAGGGSSGRSSSSASSSPGADVWGTDGGGGVGPYLRTAKGRPLFQCAGESYAHTAAAKRFADQLCGAFARHSGPPPPPSVDRHEDARCLPPPARCNPAVAVLLRDNDVDDNEVDDGDQGEAGGSGSGGRVVDEEEINSNNAGGGEAAAASSTSLTISAEEKEHEHKSGNAEALAWRWLSPWQVDNSEGFGMDRRNAGNEPVFSIRSGDLEWLYADAWSGDAAFKNAEGQHLELGYYAEPRPSSTVRCRRWVRPRECFVCAQSALPPRPPPLPNPPPPLANGKESLKSTSSSRRGSVVAGGVRRASSFLSALGSNNSGSASSSGRGGAEGDNAAESALSSSKKVAGEGLRTEFISVTSDGRVVVSPHKNRSSSKATPPFPGGKDAADDIEAGGLAATATATPTKAAKSRSSSSFSPFSSPEAKSSSSSSSALSPESTRVALSTASSRGHGTVALLLQRRLEDGGTGTAVGVAASSSSANNGSPFDK